MEKVRINAGKAREDAIRLQRPLIFSNPSKERPEIVEINYDLSTVTFPSHTGAICGVSLSEETRQDLRDYIEMQKKKGICEDGRIRHPPGEHFSEYYDRGWLRVPKENEMTVAGDLDRFLSNPHNWVLEDLGRPTPEIQRQLEEKRRQYDDAHHIQ
ncbi:MAG: hypothetical protein ACLP5V_16090 [Candidatus Bathyarchaeia archaeon]